MPAVNLFQQPDPIEPGTNNTDLNSNETDALFLVPNALVGNA
jgi:hypothetical protein